MKVSAPNDVKIYTIASSSITALPEWLQQSHKKQLRHDQNYSQRVELIQDFDFPEAGSRLQMTRDQKFIVATGVYKPQVRVFELAQMSMKVTHHTNANTVQFEILSDDWTKMVLLQADRTIEFHTPGGVHFRTRIPRYGRDMAYHYQSCDILVGGAGSEVYRLNLEQGRFLPSLQTQCTDGVNVVKVNSANQLWTFGGEDGVVEFWDHRTQSCLTRLDAAHGVGEITAITHATDGLHFAVGTSQGLVKMFDIRSNKPILIKDHQYDAPVKSIVFHEDGRHVVSADTKIIKIWDRVSGKQMTSVEPEDDINDMIVHHGLIMTTNECPRNNVFFLPALAPAPKWCAFLDNLTEELEESLQQQVWDDYKFVTRKELSHLGLDHLIGTALLKAYMHGFFVDLRLYEKAKAIANPFAYDDYKKRIIKAKLEEKSASRISATRKLPAVNKDLAMGKAGEKLMQDDRFSQMFNDAEFQVDKFDEEFVKYNTTAPQAAAVLPEDEYDQVSGDENIDVDGSGSESGDSDASDELMHYQKHERKSRSSREPKTATVTKLKMYESKAGQSVTQLLTGAVTANAAKYASFSDRVAAEQKIKFSERNSSNKPTAGAKAMKFSVTGRRGRNDATNASRGGGGTRGGSKSRGDSNARRSAKKLR